MSASCPGVVASCPGVVASCPGVVVSCPGVVASCPGVVVTLAMRARKAARSAARRLGTPALAEAFALTALSQRGSAGEVVEAAAGGEPPNPEEKAA